MENGLEREGLEVPLPLHLYPRQPGCCLATPGAQVMLGKVDRDGLGLQTGQWVSSSAAGGSPSCSGPDSGSGGRPALTSMEQPRREPFCRAFWMILNRLEGAFLSSYHSAMPPVKSSKPSVVAPPESAS